MAKKPMVARQTFYQHPVFISILRNLQLATAGNSKGYRIGNLVMGHFRHKSVDWLATAQPPSLSPWVSQKEWLKILSVFDDGIAPASCYSENIMQLGWKQKSWKRPGWTNSQLVASGIKQKKNLPRPVNLVRHSNGAGRFCPVSKIKPPHNRSNVFLFSINL